MKTNKIKKTQMKKILLLIILFILFPISSVLAYDYPIGIPDAWIEPDIIAPSLPSSWTSEQAGYYFINYQTGSDGHTYGTPSTPRQTIPNPIPAGAVIALQGDYSYANAGAIWLHANGTSSNPVWIINYDGTGKINTASSKCIVYGSYLYISGISIDGSTGTSGHDMLQIGSSVSGYGANNILFRNAEVVGNTAMVRNSGIGITGNSSGSVSQNIIIYNNEVHDTGDISSPNDDDAHIVTVGNWSSNVWILDNEIHHGSGAGSQIGGVYETDGVDNCHHVYFGRNNVYNTRQAGAGVKFAEHCVFSENYIHDIIDTSWSEAKGLGFQYHNDYIWFIYNTIVGGRFGIKGSSDNTDDVLHHYIIGNLITDVERDGVYSGNYAYEEAGIGLWGSGNIQVIVNNTIDNCDSGIVDAVYDNTTEIVNNIITNRLESTGRDLALTNQTIGDEIHDNLFYCPAGVLLKYGGSDYTSVASFDSGTPAYDDLEGNPMYISSNNWDLQSTSPARDSGVLSSVYALYQTIFGVDIKKDIEYHIRPQGSAWDMGAFEYTFSTNFRADVDNNSQINSTDAMLTLRYSLGLDMGGTDWQTSATTGDVDCSGTTNSTDAMLTLRYSLGLDMGGTGWCVE